MIHDQRNLDVFQLHHDFTLIFFTHGTQGAPNLQNPSKKKKKHILVGGIPTHLEKWWSESQWEGWHTIDEMESHKIQWFQTTKQL